MLLETRKVGPPKNVMEFNKKKEIPIKHERQKKNLENHRASFSISSSKISAATLLKS